MKSSKVFVKRSHSPSQPANTIQISDRKKKSSTNMHLQCTQNHPKRALKQFDTHGGNKTQKKKNNYLKQLIKSNNQQTNKYRIVTEPVQERLLYLGNSNFGNNSGGGGLVRIPVNTANVSAVVKVPSKSKSKLQQQQHNNNNCRHQYTEKYLKLNIRTSSQHNSKEKVKSGESFHHRVQHQQNSQHQQQCRNCKRYKQQLQHYKKELNRICMDKILWKSGQLHIDNVRESLFGLSEKRRLRSVQGDSKSNYYESSNHNNNSQQRHRQKTTTVATSTQKQQGRYNINHMQQHQNKGYQFTDSEVIKYQRSLSQQKHITAVMDRQLLQVKKHMLDLMHDIQSLSAIDYPKMLSLNVHSLYYRRQKIFHYDPFYVQSPCVQQQQLKSLLTQLRTSMQGGVTDQELLDGLSSNQMSEHNKMIFRNLKSRLGYYLRENLQLKIKKEVLERSEEITKQSGDYLRKVVEDVLVRYADDIGGE